MQRTCRRDNSTSSQSLRNCHGRDVDADADAMLAGPNKYTLNRADIGVVATPGNRNMRIADETIVPGIEGDPSQRTTPARTPGMGSIRAD